ncbi:hypothetical protein MFM001_35790 [Mycobacterium sp. MFM001]|nr:hypothetical protein MFM001_35790 [Mycobacterium sp. MFM001]
MRLLIVACNRGVMRSEHQTTADEWDAFTRARHMLTSIQRAGIRKAIKKRSHRVDRRSLRRRAAFEVRASGDRKD